jgi:ATP-dependent Clp protease ATP-binding subunit ClpA
VDVVCGVPALGGAVSRLRQGVLAELAERYRKRGLALQWDDTFVAWLEQHAARDIERLLDTEVGPRIAAHLVDARSGAEAPLIIRHDDDGVHVLAAQEDEN